MWEHRLIERMITLLKMEQKQIEEKPKANVELLTVAVDFFRTYADRTHHGKEEDILFKALAEKPLSPELKNTMNELVQDHILGRKLVSMLSDAVKQYAAGKPESLKDVISGVEKISAFYPAHIEKEDKHFFYPVLDYFDKAEQDSMLQEFWEFDRKLIHEKYQGIVETFEKKKA